MESYLNKETKKSLLELITYLKNTEEYQKCILLKEEMNQDQELMRLIQEVRTLQKKYIQSYGDLQNKNELEKKEKLLENHSLYIEYNYYLDKVNREIDLIRESFNEYFSFLMNQEF